MEMAREVINYNSHFLNLIKRCNDVQLDESCDYTPINVGPTWDHCVGTPLEGFQPFEGILLASTRGIVMAATI